ncbi:hypothetical protein [Brachybacterium sp. Marseille-Q7125]|uniref:hypothetical protein n=1 Tax=Brachybacterium sp. Marseille-Q7125 TaxID=2932815 RepID=UPI001FF4041E|nr:hypothetical protein [Brachybacterium sp. Marseille-Q7125]
MPMATLLEHLIGDVLAPRGRLLGRLRPCPPSALPRDLDPAQAGHVVRGRRGWRGILLGTADGFLWAVQILSPEHSSDGAPTHPLPELVIDGTARRGDRAHLGQVLRARPSALRRTGTSLRRRDAEALREALAAAART